MFCLRLSVLESGHGGCCCIVPEVVSLKNNDLLKRKRKREVRWVGGRIVSLNVCVCTDVSLSWFSECKEVLFAVEGLQLAEGLQGCDARLLQLVWWLPWRQHPCLSASFLASRSKHCEVAGSVGRTPRSAEVNSSFVPGASNLVSGQKYLFPFCFSVQPVRCCRYSSVYSLATSCVCRCAWTRTRVHRGFSCIWSWL